MPLMITLLRLTDSELRPLSQILSKEEQEPNTNLTHELAPI